MQEEQINNTTEKILAQYAADQKEFENHWIWKELNTTPDIFFKAVENRVGQLGIPKKEWDSAYQKMKDAIRIHALESKSKNLGSGFKWLSAMKA